MNSPPLPIEALLDLAIRHANHGQPEQARLLCEHAMGAFAPHPAVLQLLAVLALQQGQPVEAGRHAAASLALRPDHAPTLQAAGEAWFQVSLQRQDAHDLDGAAEALREVLRLMPGRAEAQVNLGIVLQESGRMDEAMLAYGRAYRLREDTFGRIAHALSTPKTGRLWLRLDDLRTALTSHSN